jgi:hypothetical protein
MHRIPALAVFLTVAWPTTSCSGITVDSDYEPGTNFSGYKTFAWTTRPSPGAAGAREVSGLVADRIKRVVEAELVLRGLAEAGEAEADLVVDYHLSVAQKTRYNDPYYAYDRAQTYEEGTLLVDLIERKTQRIVWRGSGQTRILHLKTPEARANRVREVVTAIMEQFPPKS